MVGREEEGGSEEDEVAVRFGVFIIDGLLRD